MVELVDGAIPPAAAIRLASRAGVGASAPSPDVFREAMSCYATGVTVVTTCLDGVDYAITVNTFTSLSLDPLLVLVCVNQAGRFHKAVLRSGLWCVSILGAQAKAVATRLATPRRPVADQLASVAYRRGDATGAALLIDAHATVECTTQAVYPGGDHYIVVGEVLAAATSNSHADPLVLHRRSYRSLNDRL